MDIKHLYDSLITSAFMTLDLAEYDMTSPLRLYGTHLVCDDGTEVELDLMSDENEYYFWVNYSGQYFELHLCQSPNNNGDIGWFSAMKVVETKAVEIIKSIVDGGKEYVENMIKAEGIMQMCNLIITEKRMDNIIKLPVSCAFVAFGQVFHGAKELEEYCVTQEDNSTPYVLKRSYVYSERDDYEQMDTRFCRNYLICKDKATAEIWMRDFIALGRISALSPERIMTPMGCPPLACYVDGCRYMAMSYQHGYLR